MEPECQGEICSLILKKSHRERKYQISVWRKHASFKKMMRTLPNRRVMLIVPWDKDKIYIWGYIRIMKNIFFLECYHQLCQTPVPEVEIIWNIQQNFKKTTQIQVHFSIGL